MTKKGKQVNSIFVIVLLMLFLVLLSASGVFVFTYTGFVTLEEGASLDSVVADESSSEEVVDTGNEEEEAVEEVNTQPVEEEQEIVEEAPAEESEESDQDNSEDNTQEELVEDSNEESVEQESNESSGSSPEINETVSTSPSNDSVQSAPSGNETSSEQEENAEDSEQDTPSSIEDESIPSQVNVSTNESVGNASLNLTLNTSLTNVTFGAVAAVEEVTQYGAVVGQPVKWEKRVKLDEEVVDVEIELPPNAEQIVLTEIEGGSEVKVDLAEVKVEENGALKDIRYTDLIDRDEVDLGFFQGLFSWTLQITGFSVAEGSSANDNVTLVVEEAVEDVIVEYYTEAPVAFEIDLGEDNKQVIISSETHYENILSYTTLDEVALEQISFYWYPNGTNESKEPFPFDAYDLNDNGLVDYIEWVTPHLSNQTFEVSISILTLKSYPTVLGNWTVLFNTTGSANLTIEAANGTTWSNDDDNRSLYDLKFLELRCGDVVQDVTWVDGTAFIENYSCANTSAEVAKVLTEGVHTKQFTFGSLEAYAYNTATDYSTCPNASGNFTVSTNTVWSNASYECNVVQVTNNAWLYFNSTANGNKSINLTANSLTIDAGSAVSAYLLGYMNGFGPGASTNNNLGGGYGGDGGDGSRRPVIGMPYGSILSPTESGSPGNGAGARGGGSIFLNITDVLTVNGVIDLNGSTIHNMGGSSGGGLLINTTNLTGSGEIRADGGRATASVRGGGSGGRIAIYYVNNDFTGRISAEGGETNTNSYEGAAGTVFMKNRSQEYGDLIIQNAKKNTAVIRLPQTKINSTFLEGQSSLDSITITNHSWVPIEGNLTLLNTHLFIENKSTFNQTEGTLNLPVLENLTISGVFSLTANYTFNDSMSVTLNPDAKLTHRVNNETQLYSLNLSAKNFTVKDGAWIDVTGDGYRGSQGPGGATANQVGGSYGGKGGTVSTSSKGKQTYGSVTEPLDLGSGGQGTNSVGYGGGAIFLNVSDTLVVNGTVSANSSSVANSGSGSGGSIYLVANDFRGSGVIRADAGTGLTTSRSGGGGGRIAIYYSTKSYFGNISARGGDSSSVRFEGGAGTIYLKDKEEDFGELIVKNNNFLAGITVINASQLNVSGLSNLTLANGSLVEIFSPLTIYNKKFVLNNRTSLNISNSIDMPLVENLTVYNDGYFLQNGNWTALNLSRITSFGNISFSNNYTVNTSVIVELHSPSILTHKNNKEESVYIINLTTKNFTINTGAEVMAYGNGYNGTYGPGDGGADTRGGGYGGSGGNHGSTSTGQPYGSLTAPVDVGSAGGSANGPGGGGAVILNVSDTLTIDGKISVNGSKAGNEGGGSGGSVYIITKKLAGSGEVSAKGGIALSAARSGGGGGRIALYYNASSFTGSVLKAGGKAGSAGYNGKNASHFTCNYGPASCSGSFGSEARSSSGGVLVKSNYSLNASQDINKTINITWTQGAINWTDESNGSVTGTYAISGLYASTTYDIYDNGVLNQSLATDASGNLPSFDILLASPHSISVGANGPPTVDTIVINSTDLNNYSNGTINLNYTVSDPEGQPVTVAVTWFLNNVMNVSFNNLTVIGSGNTSRGDNWTATVSTTDGSSRGTNKSTTLIVGNVPVVMGAIISPVTNDVINDTLNVTWTGATDADTGDTLYYNVTLSNPDGSFNQTLGSNLAHGDNNNFSFNLSSVTNGKYRVNVSAVENFSGGLVATNITGNITIDNNFVNITLGVPLNGSATLASTVVFEANVTNTTLLTQCDLILDGIINKSTTTLNTQTKNFTVTNVAPGSHNWTVNCSDGLTNFSSHLFEFSRIDYARGFQGNSTNLSQSNIRNISNFEVDAPNESMVNFTTNLNLINITNLSRCINVSFNRIEVNSTACPEMNAGAELTFRGLSFDNPRLLKDGAACTPEEGCRELSSSGGDSTFSVTGFSVFSTGETPANTTSSTTTTTIAAAADAEGKKDEETLPNLAPQFVAADTFRVDTEFIEFTLDPSEKEEQILTIVNEVEEQSFEITLEEVDHLVSVSNDSFTLIEEEFINIQVRAEGVDYAAVYEGLMYIEAEGDRAEIPVRVVVESSSIDIFSMDSWLLFMIVGILFILFLVFAMFFSISTEKKRRTRKRKKKVKRTKKKKKRKVVHKRRKKVKKKKRKRKK